MHFETLFSTYDLYSWQPSPARGTMFYRMTFDLTETDCSVCSKQLNSDSRLYFFPTVQPHFVSSALRHNTSVWRHQKTQWAMLSEMTEALGSVLWLLLLHHHRKYLYQPSCYHDYSCVFNVPVELLHMQVVPEHFHNVRFHSDLPLNPLGPDWQLNE